MTDQPPTSPEGMSRDDLYKNWLGWVIANLGDDTELSAIAANAAADAAVRGDGFNAAAEDARKAWVEAAPPDKALWRPGFWKLLLTNLYFWFLVGAVVTAPFVYITVVAIPILLGLVGWKAYCFWRLSRRGIVVPGSLFKLVAPPRLGGAKGRESYRATYQFDFHGEHFVSASYYSEDSVRQDVCVLFDPNRPSLAMVMPELLNPGA